MGCRTSPRRCRKVPCGALWCHAVPPGATWPPSLPQTAVPLLFALFELARNPAVQEELRAEIRAAEQHREQGIHRVLGAMPLLRAAIKETLR